VLTFQLTLRPQGAWWGSLLTGVLRPPIITMMTKCSVPVSDGCASVAPLNSATELVDSCAGRLYEGVWVLVGGSGLRHAKDPGTGSGYCEGLSCAVLCGCLQLCRPLLCDCCFDGCDSTCYCS
jgi:hypothetical protein